MGIHKQCALPGGFQNTAMKAVLLFTPGCGWVAFGIFREWYLTFAFRSYSLALHWLISYVLE